MEIETKRMGKDGKPLKVKIKGKPLGNYLEMPCPQCGKIGYTSDCQYCNENRCLPGEKE